MNCRFQTSLSPDLMIGEVVVCGRCSQPCINLGYDAVNEKSLSSENFLTRSLRKGETSCELSTALPVKEVSYGEIIRGAIAIESKIAPTRPPNLIHHHLQNLQIHHPFHARHPSSFQKCIHKSTVQYTCPRLASRYRYLLEQTIFLQ